MTLSTSNNRNEYTGIGSVAGYPYYFRVLDEDELLVTQKDASDVVTTLVKTTDYTVSGVGDALGGEVTLTSNLATGYKLIITRNMDFKQETDLGEGDNFPAETVEAVFDKLTMQDQQLEEELNRSFKLSISTTGSVSSEFPEPQALYLLRWNAAGTALENLSPSSESATAAEASATAAAVSAAAAEAAAASVNLPSISASDEDSSLEVNAAGTSFELVTFKDSIIRQEIYTNLFL